MLGNARNILWSNIEILILYFIDVKSGDEYYADFRIAVLTSKCFSASTPQVKLISVTSGNKSVNSIRGNGEWISKGS